MKLAFTSPRVCGLWQSNFIIFNVYNIDYVFLPMYLSVDMHTGAVFARKRREITLRDVVLHARERNIERESNYTTT